MSEHTKTVLPAPNAKDAMRKIKLHATVLLFVVVVVVIAKVVGQLRKKTWKTRFLWHLQTGNIATRHTFNVAYFRVVTNTIGVRGMERDHTGVECQTRSCNDVVVFATSCCRYIVGSFSHHRHETHTHTHNTLICIHNTHPHMLMWQKKKF